MDHRIIEPASRPTSPIKSAPAEKWRDLREWIALIEQNGALKRIREPVDADEELSAITYMATRGENAPALLFENNYGRRVRVERAGKHAGLEQGALCACRWYRP